MRLQRWLLDTSHAHDGGLYLPFGDLEGQPIHQISYKFSFTDSVPHESSNNADSHAFANLFFARDSAFGFVYGTCVSPRSDGNYELQWFRDVYDEDQDDTIAPVEQDVWYTVSMTFNRVTNMVRLRLATPERLICEARARFQPSAMDGGRGVTVYNFSASVSRFAEFEVDYTPPSRRVSCNCVKDGGVGVVLKVRRPTPVRPPYSLPVNGVRSHATASPRPVRSHGHRGGAATRPLASMPRRRRTRPAERRGVAATCPLARRSAAATRPAERRGDRSHAAASPRDPYLIHNEQSDMLFTFKKTN